MPAPQVDPALTELRDGLAKMLDQLTAFASALATNDPPDIDTAKANLAAILAPFAGGGASEPDGDEAAYPESADASEAQRRKRQGRPVASAFAGMDKQRKSRAADQASVTWPADLSAGKRDAALKRALGRHAPKGR